MSSIRTNSGRLTPLGGDLGGRLKYWWRVLGRMHNEPCGMAISTRLYCLEEACKHEAAGHLFVAWCRVGEPSSAIGGGELGTWKAANLIPGV